MFFKWSWRGIVCIKILKTLTLNFKNNPMNLIEENHKRLTWPLFQAITRIKAIWMLRVLTCF